MDSSKIGLFCMIFWVLVSVGIANAAVIKCDSCESCNEAIKNAPAGAVIVLSKEIKTSGNCIEITAPSITFDCRGHAITGNLENSVFGIKVANTKNVTVRNCEIKNFDIGIWIYSSSEINVEHNTISSLRTAGILAGDTFKFRHRMGEYTCISPHAPSDKLVIRENRISGWEYNPCFPFGIYVRGNNTIVEKNLVKGPEWERGAGIGVCGYGNAIRKNVIGDLEFEGISVVCMSEGRSGTPLPDRGGNSTIENNFVQNVGYYGIWVASENNLVVHNYIVGTSVAGIKIDSASARNNVVKNNTVIFNNVDGIELVMLPNKTIL